MPRFVILEHDHPDLHWDLMLEADGVLQTWRLAEPPETVCVIEATKLADHRVMYLDYEGLVSGERGTVRRWDAGVFNDEPASAAEMRILKLIGTRMHLNVRLDRIAGSTWRFTAAGGASSPS